jgi:hypothetical protein
MMFLVGLPPYRLMVLGPVVVVMAIIASIPVALKPLVQRGPVLFSPLADRSGQIATSSGSRRHAIVGVHSARRIRSFFVVVLIVIRMGREISFPAFDRSQMVFASKIHWN